MALCCWFYHDSSLAQRSSQPRKKTHAAARPAPELRRIPEKVQHWCTPRGSHVHMSTRYTIYYILLYTIIYYYILLYTIIYYYILLYNIIYYYILFTIYYICLYILYTIYYILYTIYIHIPYTIYHIPYTIYYILYTIYYILYKSYICDINVQYTYLYIYIQTIFGGVQQNPQIIH